jgi:hypothetical protein
MIHTYIPDTQEVETGGSQFEAIFGKGSVIPHLKIKKQKDKGTWLK